MAVRDHLDVRPGNQLVPARHSRLAEVLPGVELAGGLAHLTAAVFSWRLGEYTVVSGGDTYQVARGLLLYADVSDRGLGASARARTPTILRDRGLTRGSLRQRWEARRGEHGVQAILDLDLLLEVFEPPVWVALAMRITDGPERAVSIIDRVLYQTASRRVKPSPVRLEGGGLSKRTLDGYSWPMSWVMRTLVDLRQRGFPCDALDAWCFSPRLHLPRAPEANTDRSSPSLRLVRLAIQRLDQEVKRRLRADSDEEELDRLKRVAPSILRGAGLWQKMRLRALLTLACILGARADAMCGLRRSQLVRDHVGPGGELGPAIALRPGKTFHPEEIHWKPIPREALFALDALFVIADRTIAGVPDYHAIYGRCERPPPPSDMAMFPASLRHADRSISASAFYVELVGSPARPEKKRKARAPLIPRQDGRGYSPHTLRGAVMQAIERGARRYCAEHGLDDKPEQIYEALVDHTVGGDRHGYLDRNTLRGRERLSKIGTQIAWEMLATDAGARTPRDNDAYRAALDKRRVLNDELQRNRQQIRSARENARRGGASTNKLLIDLGELSDDREELEDRRAEVDRELERLRTDPATRIAISDEVPDSDLVDRFDDLDREMRDAAPNNQEGAAHPSPVREPRWVTIRELSFIAGISYQQAARWANGKHLPFRPGDPRRPFEPSALPVDRSLGPRKCRIAVDGLNPGFLQSDGVRTRLAEVLASWPPHWSKDQCQAPFPEGFHSHSG